MDTRSPIARLIDAACGLTTPVVADSVTLRCPQCRRTQQVRRHPSDLPGTQVVQARCPACCGSERDDIRYFDAQGQQILEGHEGSGPLPWPQRAGGLELSDRNGAAAPPFANPPSFPNCSLHFVS